ncbi:His-Xaa-Ser system protein HxsD [Spirosoma pollinicola]|uniref:His-Xaa-Ser system protein HxsD n=1 Tax=Spirosoma pollinicola TaxID=2057025 RepID=UPI0014767E7F|nr:His-Xaa-Ser system protein HxsD [Spirosoma pollinicola]
MRNNYTEGDSITVFADTALYSKEAVFKCLYWYGNRFHTSVSLLDEATYLIRLRLLAGQEMAATEMELYLQKLERDLIDFNLRDIVTRETKNVRDLLIAKAFSNGEFDEDPPGELSDPVGFAVNQMAND